MGVVDGAKRVTCLAKVHLVKDDLVRVSNAPEARHKGEHRQHCHGHLVVPLATGRRCGLPLVLCFFRDGSHLFRERLGIGRARSLALLARALAYSPRRRRHGGGGVVAALVVQNRALLPSRNARDRRRNAGQLARGEEEKEDEGEGEGERALQAWSTNVCR